jgi:hypothetical protein
MNLDSRSRSVLRLRAYRDSLLELLSRRGYTIKLLQPQIVGSSEHQIAKIEVTLSFIVLPKNPSGPRANDEANMHYDGAVKERESESSSGMSSTGAELQDMHCISLIPHD